MLSICTVLSITYLSLQECLVLPEGFQELDLIENDSVMIPLNIIKLILPVISPSNDRIPITMVPVCRDPEPQKLFSWHIFLSCY